MGKVAGVGSRGADGAPLFGGPRAVLEWGPELGARGRRPLDERLVQFALHDHAEHSQRCFEELLGGREPALEPELLEILAPMALYELPLASGELVAEDYLARERGALKRQDEQKLRAALAARLSIWEVLRVVPGSGLELVDRLGGERAFVHARARSTKVRPRSGLLCRVAELGTRRVFAGLHPHQLPPSAVDAAVDELRARGHGHRDRRGPDPGLARALYAAWQAQESARTGPVMIDPQPLGSWFQVSPELLAFENLRAWPHRPHPELGGLRPAQAVAEAETRRQVHALLREMEHRHDASYGPAIAGLRAGLGLDLLGERVARRSPARARPASELLVEFALPVLLDAANARECEAALCVAQLVWNEVEPESFGHDLAGLLAASLDALAALAPNQLELELGRLREWIEVLAGRRALFEDRLELAASELGRGISGLRSAALETGTTPRPPPPGHGRHGEPRRQKWGLSKRGKLCETQLVKPSL